MLKSYIKIALRNFKRFKGYSFVNVFGLALSMAVCLLIILFIRDQRRYDAFHANADRIYRVYSDYKSSSNSDKQRYAMSPAGLGEVLPMEVADVEQVVQIYDRFGGLASHEGHSLPLKGFYTGPAFFEVFSFRLAQGDARTALVEPYSLVLSEEATARFFGDADPLGQVLTFQEGEHTVHYTITGVLEAPPLQSHLPLEAIASLATVQQGSEYTWRLADWTRSIYGWYTYVLLKEGASSTTLENRFPEIIAQHFAPRDNNVLHALHLQDLQAINLGTPMGNQLGTTLPNFVVYFLAALAAVIMLVACFNYVGLTVARALQRTREVGVRKVRLQGRCFEHAGGGAISGGDVLHGPAGARHGLGAAHVDAARLQQPLLHRAVGERSDHRPAERSRPVPRGAGLCGSGGCGSGPVPGHLPVAPPTGSGDQRRGRTHPAGAAHAPPGAHRDTVHAGPLPLSLRR